MEGDTAKSKLISLLKRAHAEQQVMLDALSAPERDADGTFERWAAKDVLAHNTFWQARLVQNLAAVKRGETPDEADEFDEINREVFTRNHARPRAEILAESEHVFADLLTEIESFSEQELTEPNRYPLREGRSIAARAIGNSCEHPILHITLFFIQRGEVERARQIQETHTAALLEFDPSPEARGNALYNLACFDALAGDSQHAVELLRQAFPLRPTLVEWSKQDTDLESLRELPEFKALYN